MNSLTTHQSEALARFGRLRAGAVFMRQGSGKTRVGIVFANQTGLPLLWVGPYSTLDTVRQEADRWGLDIPARWVGYETISGSDRQWLDLHEWASRHEFMLIADESSFIKNAEAKRTIRLNLLRQHAARVLILNGTPVTRDLWDLKRQMDFLHPKILGMGDNQFRAQYFSRISIMKKGKRKEFYREFEPNVKHLQSLVAPYVYHAELDLNIDRHQGEHVHHVGETTRQAYGRLRKETLDEYDKGDGSRIIAYLARLNQAANIDQAKHEAIGAMVKGRRVLVFTPWLAEQAALVEQTGGLAINGATPASERSRLLERFHQQERPLIMTFGVGAFGLNLQHATNQVHFASLIFDYAHMDHAQARIVRLGQTQPVTAHYHLSSLPISRTIMTNLKRKSWLSEIVKRNINLGGLI